MALCDGGITRFVTEKYYEELASLSPPLRASRILRHSVEELAVEVRAEDGIIGWFRFEGKAPSSARPFPDCVPSEEWVRVTEAPLLHGSRTCLDKGHTLLPYETVLGEGLSAYRERIEAGLAVYPEDETLLAMRESLYAVEVFVEKMREAALAAYAAGKGEVFLSLAESLRRIPFAPARDFREAVETVWILHFLAPLAENAWYSISLGRFDQYMLPYYRASREAGMTEEEARAILHQFYLLLNSYADGACMLNVGSECNELSRLLIDCQKEFGLPGPILGARIAKDTPDEIWRLLVDERLFSRGQPTFYGEASCIAALREKGVAAEDAPHFSNNSCMGISLVGEEFNSMWGCVFSVSAALEAALSEGRLLSRDFTVPGIGAVCSMEEILCAFEKAVSYLFSLCAASYEARAEQSERCDPDPFVSLLTNGCIEGRCDRIRGAKYHNVTVECMGMANVADGLSAIDRLVFREGKYTLREIVSGVKCNFEGAEVLRQDLLSAPKYGEDSEGDGYAVRVAEVLAGEIRRHSHGNFVYSPSLHTLDANVGYGSDWGAGFDGRRRGEPFAKNAGPSDGVRRKDPTALILSAAKLPQRAFFGGQPIDVNFAPQTVREHGEEIARLIRVYLERGGLQMQVNSLSSALLWDAIDHPERHKDLVVRIGGFSNYFNAFPEATKREFARRMEKEERA